MTKEKINMLKTLGEYNALNQQEITHYKNCPICGSIMQKSDYRKYCSEECLKKAKQDKFSKYPSFEEISDKYKELNS